MKSALKLALVFSVLILFCASNFAQAKPDARKQITFFTLWTSSSASTVVPLDNSTIPDPDNDPFGWMQGKAIISKTLLTPEEAKDYCNGKKTKSGVKTYSGHGDYEINGSDYGYFYAMERVMGTFSPNLKFELKGYKLSNRSYIIKIDESETGEG